MAPIRPRSKSSPNLYNVNRRNSPSYTSSKVVPTAANGRRSSVGPVGAITNPGTEVSSGTSTPTRKKSVTIKNDNGQPVSSELSDYIERSSSGMTPGGTAMHFPPYKIDKKSLDIEARIINEDQIAAMKKNPGADIIICSLLRTYTGPAPENIKHRLPNRVRLGELTSPSIITNNIVIGSKRDAANLDRLRELGVTHVLNVAKQVPNSFPNDFVYLKLDLVDHPDCQIVRDYFTQAGSFLKHVEFVRGRVLVHCVSGISRSVVIVILYLIGVYRLSLKQAFNYIHYCRPHIAPNDGFKLQMALFEIDQLGCSSVVRNAGPQWDFYEWNKYCSCGSMLNIMIYRMRGGIPRAKSITAMDTCACTVS